MAKRMPKVGGTFLQAESEVAAINMVYGAVSTGVRAMTSSSSPGISLKSEGISYLAGADLPALIVNIQRGGPGLGGIQPAQSDYYQATRGPGHGDSHVFVFAPNSIQEIVNMVFLAFEKSDEYRIPSMILGDSILGQMMEPVSFPENVEIKEFEKPWAASGTRGMREHNIINSLYLQPEELEAMNFERFKRYEIVKQKEQSFEEFMTEDADVIIVAYGASARIAKNAIRASREKGIKVGLIRPITLWPFPVDILKKTCQNGQGFHFCRTEYGPNGR